MNDRASLEQVTGQLFGGLWGPYGAELFEESVQLFLKRLRLAQFDCDWLQDKTCLDAGCGGGRNSLVRLCMSSWITMCGTSQTLPFPKLKECLRVTFAGSLQPFKTAMRWPAERASPRMAQQAINRDTSFEERGY